MASTTWTPYGVAFTITATSGTVTRTSATAFTVKINASWKVYWDGASTNYGMTALSGGGSKNLNSFGTYASSGSGSFTGTYSISGYGAQTKSITVTFTNTGPDSSATKSLTLSVSVPAWPSYAVKYNANGGSGAPSAQTKYKNVDLTLSTTKPTRTGHSFKNWNTKADGSGTTYASGGGYTGNAALTLYAQWKANTYTVKFNANGGTGAPGNQTKTYGQTLTLSTTKPTRTNYNFLGWATSASAASAQYAAGGSYTDNSAVTLYAVWELAYWKPKITSLAVSRCTSDGTADEYGTCVKVAFNWELCQLLGTNETATINIDWTGDGTADATFTGSGASGTLSEVVGADAIDVNSSYTFIIKVTDNRDSTELSRTVGSSAFAIDFLAGGKGVAFGKAASREGFDVGMRAYFSDKVESTFDDIGFIQTHPTTGNVVGLGVGASGNNRGVWTKDADASGGRWLIYDDGTDARINSKGSLKITSPTACLTNRAYGVNKVLWSGANFMNASQTITLSEAISAQPSGIVLIWSYYSDGEERSYNFHMHFIPKYYVSAYSGNGVDLALANHTGNVLSNKYVYVSDTQIKGHANNDVYVDGSDIDYNNALFVLRSVIGV